MDYDEDYYTKEEMEAEAEYERDHRWDDGPPWDDPDDEAYDYEVYTPVFTWRDWPRLRLIELRQTVERHTTDILKGFIKDPGAMFRRCVSCGERGCVPGEQVCFSDWIPF